MSVWEDIGGWIEDNVTVSNILRYVGGAVLSGYGWVASGVLDMLPGGAVGIVGTAAKAIIVSVPSLVEGKDLQTAIITELTYQGMRAATAYVTSVGGPSVLADQAKAWAVGHIPPEVLAGGQTALDYLRSPAGQFFTHNVLKKIFYDPIDKMIRDARIGPEGKPVSSLRSSVLAAIETGRRTGEGPYVTLQKAGLSPDQISKRIGGREDAIAIGLNILSGEHLYDIDWFDALTGKFSELPGVWQNNYWNAQAKDARPEVQAEMRRRWDSLVDAKKRGSGIDTRWPDVNAPRGPIKLRGSGRNARAEFEALQRNTFLASQTSNTAFQRMLFLSFVSAPLWLPRVMRRLT